MSFLDIDMAQVVEILPQKDKDLPILHSQYHGCWCPGDPKNQDISYYDIELVKPRYIGPSTLRVKGNLDVYLWRQLGSFLT